MAARQSHPFLSTSSDMRMAEAQGVYITLFPTGCVVTKQHAFPYRLRLFPLSRRGVMSSGMWKITGRSSFPRTWKHGLEQSYITTLRYEPHLTTLPFVHEQPASHVSARFKLPERHILTPNSSNGPYASEWWRSKHPSGMWQVKLGQATTLLFSVGERLHQC